MPNPTKKSSFINKPNASKKHATKTQGKAHVIVAGAGIVGVATAIWLQRAGYKVTLIDRIGPAAGASYGNAGILAAGAIIPVTTPDLWYKAPLMLFSRKSPLFLRITHLAQLIPFLTRYLAKCTTKNVTQYAARISPLLYDSLEQHLALAGQTEAKSYIKARDYCFGYAREVDFEKDQAYWQIRKKNSVDFEVMNAKSYCAYDPFYDNHPFETVVRCKNHGFISDPSAYIHALFAHFKQQNGNFEQAEITDFKYDANRITALLSPQGAFSGDHIVLTAGIWAKPLLQKLGVHIQMMSERGYHIELSDPSLSPISPMMVCQSKFVITPMLNRIRLAGLVEFAKIDTPPSKAPIDFLKDEAIRLMPHIRYAQINQWMGERPSTPDSLPLIGLIDRFKNLYAGFGHQHLGLTAGPKTGRILADQIKGIKPNIDTQCYLPQRFKT
ncbi:MAG: FAD-binding oxidoreductase [Pseudomonadota bacterium]